MPLKKAATNASQLIKKKQLFVFSLSVFLIFLIRLYITVYPTHYAQVHTPPNRVFSGHAAWFDPWDLNVYYATIRFGQKNGILLQNTYTTTDHEKVLYYPLYTLAGYLAPNANPIDIYQAMVPFVMLLLTFTYAYAGYKLTHSYRQALAIVFITTSIRGFGGLVPPSFNPPDITLTSFTLRSAFQRPHEGIGMVLYTLAMLFLYQFLRDSKPRYIALSTAANLLLTVFYPYYFANYLLTFALFIFWQRKNLKTNLLVLFGSGIILTLATYAYFLNIQHSSFMIAVNEVQPKLSLLQLLIGYGVLLPLIPLAFFLHKKGPVKNILVFLSIWLAVSLLLSYTPIGFSRFFLRNLFFPLAVIAILAIHKLFTKKGKYVKTYGTIAVIIVYLLGLQCLTTLQINSSRLQEVGSQNFWFYYPMEYEDAFEVLRQFPRGNVLSPLAIGNLIPAHSDHSSYLGHPIQTPDSRAKAEKVDAFLNNRIPTQQARKMLLENNIQYVLLDKNGNESTQLDYPFLKNVFENDLCTLYVFQK